MALDATLMGENANSYVTVLEADTYFSNHFNALKSSTWDALDFSVKEQTLTQACWDLEQFRYTVKGDPSHAVLKWDSKQGRFTAYSTPSKTPVPYSIYQALQFPRNVDFKSTGTIYIPERVKMAQYEQAMYLINLDETALSNRLQGINLDRVTIGEITVTQEYAYQGTTMSVLAYEWLKPFFLRTSRYDRA
jgi:hypothetical protein